MRDQPLRQGEPAGVAELLTVEEAARFLRISRNLAYDLVARHELPCVRLGRVIRIPRTMLERWLTAQAEVSTAVPAMVSLPPRHR